MNAQETTIPNASHKPGRFVCETESNEHNHDRRDPVPEITQLPSVEFDPPQATLKTATASVTL